MKMTKVRVYLESMWLNNKITLSQDSGTCDSSDLNGGYGGPVNKCFEDRTRVDWNDPRGHLSMSRYGRKGNWSLAERIAHILDADKMPVGARDYYIQIRTEVDDQ